MQKLLLILVSLMVFGVSAAPPVGWTLTEARYINDVLNRDGRPPLEAILSPDGSTLAWGERGQDGGLCLYTLADETQICYPWPEMYDRSGTDLTWSSDSQSLAFTEDFFRAFRESDIWIFETPTTTFTVATQDNEYDDILDEDFSGLLDYLPLWNPSDNRLYFFRSLKLEEGYSLELHRLNDGEAELVRDFTDNLPMLSVFRAPVFSPDGTKMALPVYGRERNDPQNGLWIYDLQHDELQQLITQQDIFNILPAWASEGYFYTEDIQWSGNNGFVILLFSSEFRFPFGAANYYYIDVSTGEITPLIDFSNLEGPDEFFEADEQGNMPLAQFPRMGVVTPDGNTFLYVHYIEPNDEEVSVSALPLPPGNGEPQRIGTIENSQGLPTLTPTMGSNGMAYMFAYLMQFEQQ